MKVKTSQIFVGAIVLSILSQGENVRRSMDRSAKTRERQSDFSERIQQNKAEERESVQLSKVAIGRYKTNCIFVVDEQTGKESYFQQNTPVIDTKLSKTLRTGVSVCNRLGDTAVINELGQTTDIARVVAADLPQLKKMLEQRR